MSGPCCAVSLRTMAVVDRMAHLNNEGKLPSPPPRLLAGQEASRRARRENAAALPQAGCRGRSPRRGNRGSPPVSKNVGGWAGGTTAHAKPTPPLKEGARQDKTIRPHRRPPSEVRGPCHTPLVKYELLCYDSPMRWAAGPLLLLGACRIHTALEANHRESPCGRGAEGTTQGARPSEEGWDRSQCRYKAQAVWSHPAP